MIAGGTSVIHVGISSLDKMRDRTLAIARGEHSPVTSEPKVWFTSIEALAKVFSEKNMLMLETIGNSQALTLSALAQKLNRSEADLAYDLHILEGIGLVAIQEDEQGSITGLEKTPYSRVKAEVVAGKSKISWEVEIGAGA
jgi:predicted transcriptional regulator